MTEKPRRARFRQQPRLETPLGHLIAGDIDQAEYRRRMSLKVHREQPDPDPRYVAEDDDQRVPRHDAYEPVSSKRVWRLLFLIFFAILLALYATSRSAAVMPASSQVPTREPDQRQTVASPDGRVGGAAIPRLEAPVSSPTGGVSSIVVARGTWAYANASHGPRYLAIPEGPGWIVEVCGPLGCLERVSTDAGPELWLQRAGRIGDLSSADFEAICGPVSVGLCSGSYSILGAADQSGDDPPEHPDDARLRVEDGGPGPTLPATDAVQ